MDRHLVPSFRPAVAVFFVATSLAINATGQISLTGANVFSADATGASAGGQFFNVGGSGSWNLYVTSPNAGMAAPFDNIGTGAPTIMSAPLGTGTYQFWAYAEPNGSDRTWGMNLYFNGDSTPDISVVAPMASSSSLEPVYTADGSFNTRGLNSNTGVQGSGSITAIVNGASVTLTDFSWSDPGVYSTDRVGPVSPSSNGYNDYVGTFTLKVGTPIYTSIPSGPVGIQFAQAGPQLGPSETAGVVPQSDFNTVSVNNSTGTSGITHNLLDANGETTGITLTHVSNDGYNSQTDTTTPNGILLHGEDKTGPPGHNPSSGPGLTATYTFNNVPAGNYELVAYTENDYPSSSAVNANVSVGSTTYYITDEAVTGGTPAFVSANNTNPNQRATGNYVKFTNVIPTNGSITLTNTSEGGPNNNTAAINGLQLIPRIGFQTTTQTPAVSLISTNSPGATDLLVFNGNSFIAASKTANTAGYINPNLPTIVLTHGFAEDYAEWPTQMANQIVGAGSLYNVVAWNWQSDATGKIGEATSRVDPQGNSLASALSSALGAQYANKIQFIGHSLGALVDAQAINVFATADSHAQIQDTLLDEAEAATQLSPGRFPFASALPNPQIAPNVSIDNYISSFGELLDGAANVILQTQPGNPAPSSPPSLSTDLAWLNYLNAFHNYPVTWYQQSTNAGSVWSTILGTAGGPPAGTEYFEQNLSNPLTVTQFTGQTQMQEAQAIIDHRDSILNAIGPRVLTAALDYNGIRGAVQVENQASVNVNPDSTIQVILQKQVYSSSISQTSQYISGRPSFLANESVTPPTSSSYAWIPIFIPSNAEYLSLDFTEGNLSPLDLLSVGIDDTPLFQLENEFITDGATTNTGLLDVSQWAGQDVQLFLGLVASDDNNPGASIDIQNISFEELPEPGGMLLSLAVALCAIGLRRRTSPSQSIPLLSRTDRRVCGLGDIVAKLCFARVGT